LIVHVDNAKFHTSERTREFMEKTKQRGAPRPAFSRDLAASGFFLFGYIKGQLLGTEFTEQDGLLVEIREILSGA
jgi:hypothetical protein